MASQGSSGVLPPVASAMNSIADAAKKIGAPRSRSGAAATATRAIRMPAVLPNSTTGPVPGANSADSTGPGARGNDSA